MSMFANSTEYWKARAGNAEDQLAALKEENESLWETLLKIGIYLDIDSEWARKQPGKPSDIFIGKIGAIKAQVAELEGTSEALRSSLENAAAMLSGAIRDGRLSEIDRIVFSDKRKMELCEILDFANEILGATLKEPANEG